MEEEKKKTTFLFVFSTYLPVFLLKFWSRELVGCGIWFRIQKVPTLHTLDGPLYPKKRKYLKKCDDETNKKGASNHCNMSYMIPFLWAAKVCYVRRHPTAGNTHRSFLLMLFRDIYFTTFRKKEKKRFMFIKRSHITRWLHLQLVEYSLPPHQDISPVYLR